MKRKMMMDPYHKRHRKNVQDFRSRHKGKAYVKLDGQYQWIDRRKVKIRIIQTAERIKKSERFGLAK
ncbi:MAG: hypothetical protein ABSB28_12005 [Candidatus Bathyarchaeia archaeon]